MPTGDKIKKARLARGLTQKELGEKVGLTDVRIRQYELNNRTQKEDTLRAIAKALDVNYHSLCEPTLYAAEEVMFSLFELDDHYPLGLHQIKVSADTNGPREQIGLTFEQKLMNDFLMEWMLRKQELLAGKISKEEYEEWKRNWPQTCDDGGNSEPKKKWKIKDNERKM